MGSIKPRLLHNPVILAIGQGCGFRANQPVQMNEVVTQVLVLTGFGEAEIREYGKTVKKAGEDDYEGGLRDLRRKIHFAFRNQRGQSKGAKSTPYCKVPLTTLVKSGNWALTEFGAIMAKRLSEETFRATPATAPVAAKTAPTQVSPQTANV